MDDRCGRCISVLSEVAFGVRSSSVSIESLRSRFADFESLLRYLQSAQLR